MSKYNYDNTVILEKREDEVLIHPAQCEKLSWEDTYKEMACAEQGKWDDWQEVDVVMEAHL